MAIDPLKMMLKETVSKVKPPVLVPKLLLGLNTSIKGNVHCLSDTEILASVGSVLTIYDEEQQKQKLIQMPDQASYINLIVLGTTRKHVAVCTTGENMQLIIYCPQTHQKLKHVSMPPEKNITAKRIEAVSFTCDGKLLTFVVGEPNWLMMTVKLDKIKVDTFTKANNPDGTGAVTQICSNPSDPNLLVLLGNGLLRFLSCGEGVWRQFGFNKAENRNFISGCWLNQDRFIAGTSRGKLMFFESGDLKRVFSADETDLVLKESRMSRESNADCLIAGSQGEAEKSDTILTFSEVEGEGFMEEEEEGIEEEMMDNLNVTHMTYVSRGFLFGFRRGCIHFYEKTGPHVYTHKLLLRIPQIDMMRLDDDIKEEQIEFIHKYYNEVQSISIPPLEDKILVSCNETQIYTGLLDDEGEIMMNVYGLPMHHGPVCTIAVCLWKPIFLSAGCFDRMLRVWNYENETMELQKKYQEDIFTCDLHPTGFFAVVGFTDKVRILKIMFDDFVSDREYPIRGCKLVKYSKLGHLFALVNGNMIQVYSSVSYEHMFNLKGHNGIVTAISWTQDDTKMSSCGTEGAVYEWQISTTRRICETIIKVCQFSGLAITNDGKSNYAVGSDGRVREIVNSNVYHELKITSNTLDCMAMANSDGMMFVSGDNGVVYTMLIPVNEASITNSYVVHNKKVSSIAITHDDKYLISASPSCICIWYIKGATHRMVHVDKDYVPSEDVMIKRTDFMEKVALFKELQVRMNEMQTEHSYQIRQTISSHTATVNELRERCQQIINELKEHNEDLELEHNIRISNINVDIINLKKQHDTDVQKLEAGYIEKLIVEYNKYMLLEEKLHMIRDNYNKQLANLADAKRVSEKSMIHSYEAQLTNKTVRVDELQTKLALMAKEDEMAKEQIEDAADREIFELKSEFEERLRDEQDYNVRLRSETQSSQKMLKYSEKNTDDLTHTLHTHELEEHKLKSVVMGLEKNVSDLRNEISERDLTIEDKEKRIAELKNSNQELEKLKFILNYKIHELHALIEPRDRTIDEQSEQIRDMLTELENLQKLIRSLEVHMAELREKLRAASKDTRTELLKNTAAKANLRSIKNDIHKVSGYIHIVPKLQKGVRDMYRKHTNDKDFVVTYAEDVEAKKEFMRQRDYLQETVTNLKKKVTKSKAYTHENLRLIEQNEVLINQANNLRMSLKAERKDNRRMSALLGMKTNDIQGTNRLAALLDPALLTSEEIGLEYVDVIETNQNCMKVLRSENTRLRNKIAELLHTHMPRPPSETK